MKKNLNTRLLLFFIGLAITIFLAHGNTGTRSLSPAMAEKYADVLKIPLVTNTPYTFVYSIQNRRLEEKKYFKNDEVEKYFCLKKHPREILTRNHENVVIIILESFSAEFIGSLNNYKGYTPFLDSLIGQSLVFDHAVANAERSNKGIASVISGMPSLMDEAIASSLYKNNNLPGLGTYLKEMGYYTSFFHGGTNGTMNFVFIQKVLE